MSGQFIGIGILFIVLLLYVGLSKNHRFAMTKTQQHYNLGFTIGCKDGKAGKDPDLTQYDKVDGFGNHSI